MVVRELIMSKVLPALFLFCLAGCFSSNPSDIEAFVRPEEVEVVVEKYVLQPPDEVEIQASKVPEIHQQKQRIRPDGKISFEGLGTLSAAGKTPEELAEDIRMKAIELYKLPAEKPIDVRVVTYRSSIFYVLGEVDLPGPKLLTGRNTVFSALAEASPTVLAWEERVQVIRPAKTREGKARIFEVNYDRMTARGELDKNVLLEEGDILYVPPTVMSAIAMKVEEFVRPIGRAFSAVYTARRASNADAR